LERTFDCAVIGAGITGCAIARRLCLSHRSVALLDACEDVAMGASRANSAIVHAGYDCAPGSLQARLNVEGNVMFPAWCEELEVPLQRIGSLVAAFGEADDATVRTLYERGVTNGVPDMRIVSGDEAREIEPQLSGDVTSALWAPTAGITCPYQLTIACFENAMANGLAWFPDTAVTSIEDEGEYLLVRSGERAIRAKYVVNAAGVFADDVARMVNDASFAIMPRKGEYMLLDRSAPKISTVIFQTPSKLGKGILVAPTVDGNSFAGPTAVDMEDKCDTSVTQEGIDLLTRMAKKSVPGFNARGVITSFAGVRAQPSTGDFIIRYSEIQPKMLHVAGICSPGLTCAPAIAEDIALLLSENGMDTAVREDAVRVRSAIPEFRHMTDEQRERAIAENPLYGRVICRCETITEAEIVEAIRRGARSIDGVKRRTRAGMGRCQGGFCSPRVMEILVRETGIPVERLTKFGGGSWLVLNQADEKEAQ
jgi:glycerol-3-phosphate dehydrogenase